MSDTTKTDYDEFVFNLTKTGDDLVLESNATKQALNYALVGLFGEVGELADCIKKHTGYNKEIDTTNLIEELGDIEFYLQAIRNIYNLNRDTILADNRAKLEKRFRLGAYSNKEATERKDKK